MTEPVKSPAPHSPVLDESTLIPATDLKIETDPYSPPGGQHVGVSTGVRVTHIPTCTIVTCGLARSQYRNVRIAIAMLEAGLTHPNAS